MLSVKNAAMMARPPKAMAARYVMLNACAYAFLYAIPAAAITAGEMSGIALYATAVFKVAALISAGRPEAG